MMKMPSSPPLEGLRRQIKNHRQSKLDGGKGDFVRQTYCLNRHDAREKARQWFDDFPKAAYWTEVESWRQVEGDRIEFTMRRLPSAD